MSALSDICAERDRLLAALVAVRTVMRAQGGHIAAENEDVSTETAEMVLAAYEAVDAALAGQRSESGGAARHAQSLVSDSAQAERGAADGVEIMDEWDFGFPREILGETNRRMSDSERKSALQAASGIWGFSWRKTDEGRAFWHNIHLRLFRISQEGN